jgi:hypothetical protein
MSWYFHQDTAGMWRWIRVERARMEAQSEQGFAAKMECIADAKPHGFRERAHERMRDEKRAAAQEAMIPVLPTKS